MDEVSPVTSAAPESVGETLRAARERQGLSLSEIASRTRVPLRHLEAIETGNYNGLPSHTYATGFVKAYARAVGVDEVAINRQLRGELANSGPRAPEYQPYEAPDPARVPSRGLAIVALGVALAVIVLAGLWYSGMLSRGAVPNAIGASTGGPDAVVPAPVAAAPAAAPPPATAGQVTLSVVDRAWLRVHDGNRTLYIGTMSPGERFDVPADAQNPMVDVGRPEQLRVMLNGSVLPPLDASGRAVKNLRIGAEAVQARLNGTVAPPSGATPAPAASSTPRQEASTGTAPPSTPSQRADGTARTDPDATAATPPAGLWRSGRAQL